MWVGRKEESRSWASSSHFSKIPPPHSSNDKSPQTFDCEGRPAIWISTADFCGPAPPWLRREKLASLTKGNQRSICNSWVSALERDLEIPAIATPKWWMEEKCCYSKVWVSMWQVSDTLRDSEGPGECWAWIGVLLFSCRWRGGDGNDWISQGHPWFLLYWNLILYRGYIYLFIYIYIYLYPPTHAYTHAPAHAPAHTRKVFDRLSVF